MGKHDNRNSTKMKRRKGQVKKKARNLKAIGRAAQAQSWALACEAKGGNPN